MLYIRTDYFLISDITKGYSLGYLDCILFSLGNGWFLLEVSPFYIKPRCVRVAASAKSPSARASIDRWETARARTEGGHRRTAVDQAVGMFSRQAAVALICSTYDGCFRLPNASLRWVYSAPPEQSEPNQNPYEFPQLSPCPPCCCFACMCLSHSETELPVPISCLPRACTREDWRSYSHQTAKN